MLPMRKFIKSQIPRSVTHWGFHEIPILLHHIRTRHHGPIRLSRRVPGPSRSIPIPGLSHGLFNRRGRICSPNSRKDLTMIAIETRFIPATNTKPYRIVAETCNGHRLVMSQSAADNASQDTGNGEASQRYVAQALADKMQWGKLRDSGGTKRGMVFCFPDK